MFENLKNDQIYSTFIREASSLIICLMRKIVNRCFQSIKASEWKLVGIWYYFNEAQKVYS